MRLVIHKVRWKNFLSTGNFFTEVVLDQYNTTLICGRNGSGKSTLLDALSFALFNKPFRNINKPMLVNSITGKDCVVECEFTINGHFFKVVRGISPTIFEIWKEGELINPPADNRDYQNAFEQYIIRVNHKTFCQVVALGSAIFTPFMALKAKEKRDVIEDLLNLIIFSRMNVLLKSKISELDKDISGNNHEKRLLEQQVDLITKHLEELKQNFDDAIRDGQNAIDHSIIQIARNDYQIAEHEKKIQELNAKKVAVKPTKELTQLQIQFESKLTSNQKMIKFLDQHENCPTCNQSIDAEFKQQKRDEANTNIFEMQEAIDKLKKKIKTAEKKINHNMEIDDSIKMLTSDIAMFNRDIRREEQSIKSIKEGIAALEKKKTEKADAANIDELNEKLIALDAKVIDQTDDMAVMNFAASMLKDSGIKAQFLRIYIPIINKAMQKYLDALDFSVGFKLDENFQETIKSRYRDDFLYESFSQGEKAKLDLALLFTWREIAAMRGSIDCNVLIFDEIMDGPTDVDNLEDMLKLIKSLTGETNVVIISHKTDLIADKFDRVIEFEKVRNFSRIKT